MSIRIDRNKCQGCGKCRSICPGNLLDQDAEGKVAMRYSRDCWGCTACVKECRSGAISFYLGSDIGGRGTTLYVKPGEKYLDWIFIRPDGTEKIITIDKKQSNKY